MNYWRIKRKSVVFFIIVAVFFALLCINRSFFRNFVAEFALRAQFRIYYLKRRYAYLVKMEM